MLKSFTGKPFKLTQHCTVPGATLGLCYAYKDIPKKPVTSLNKPSGWTAATEAFGATTAMCSAIKVTWKNRVRPFGKALYGLQAQQVCCKG